MSATPERKPRVRYGPLPELPVEVAIPYANTRAGALTPAQTVRAMLDSDVWRKEMKPALDAFEARRRNPNKVQPLYTAEELESVHLYQRVAGIDTVRETREHLTSHAGAEARRLLGFDRPRQGKGQVTQIHAVPSEATLSRYQLAWAPADAGRVAPATKEAVATGKTPTLYDFKEAEVARKKAAITARANLYRSLFTRWVAEYAKTPGAAEASRALFVDGVAVKTYFKCRITKTKELKDEKGNVITDETGKPVKVTVPMNDEPRERERCQVKPVLDSRGNVVWDGQMSEAQWEALEDNRTSAFRPYWAYSADGGFGGGNSPSRSGHGYSIIDIVDTVGMPIEYNIGPIQNDERGSALELLKDFGDTLKLFSTASAEEAVQPGRPKALRVLVGDSGFTGYPMLSRIRALNMLESIHVASGSPSDQSKTERDKRRKEKRYIPYPNRKTGKLEEHWYSNGLYELSCDCGHGEVQKRFRRDDDGKLIPSLEGQCSTCGPITITSGHWVYRDKRWKKVLTNNPLDEPDLAFGNPLTYDSPIAKAYGKRRFAVQEGVHSILSNRFALTRGPRRVKYEDEVRLRTAMTFSVMHLLAAEERKRCAGSTRTVSQPVRKAA